MTSIINSIEDRRKLDLEYIKESQKHFEDFAKWFDREDRYEKLVIAMELLDSYLGLAAPDGFLLDLYDTDIRFRVVFDKLYSFHRNISKRIINHKLLLLIKYSVESQYYSEDDSFALSLLKDYKMVYGSPMHKEVFKNDLKEFFPIKRIKQWLN